MQYLSDKSVAARYDVSRPTVWRWLKEGKLPRPEKLTNGTTRWKLSDLEAAEAKREAAGK
ncbi:MAG: helix-turn-helix domain-containing protein [Pseudohongiellaceae bacterium]